MTNIPDLMKQATEMIKNLQAENQLLREALAVRVIQPSTTFCPACLKEKNT